MTSAEMLEDAFQRIRDAVHPAVNGLSPEELSFRPDSESNSIAWLVWHLTRIQDDHVAGLDGKEQVWTAKGWA
ncbi:MAG: DinB family protein, partial [Acidimicrobiales bacterium]